MISANFRDYTVINVKQLFPFFIWYNWESKYLFWYLVLLLHKPCTKWFKNLLSLKVIKIKMSFY